MKMKRISLVAAVLAGCWSKPGRVEYDGVDDPVTLVAGQKHACVIINDGDLRCWGKNLNAQLGVPVPDRSGTPGAIEQGKKYRWLAAGAAHTCGITTDDELRCWGDDSQGQVGHEMGETNSLPGPVSLPGGAVPAKVFAGYDATCAIDKNGHLLCWGAFDPLAPVDAMPHTKPVEVKPGGNDGPWRSIAFGEHHVCALNDGDNRAYCWGKNSFGELGTTDDTALDNAKPAPGHEFVALAAGPEATCGITLDRELVCFGDASRGLIGPAPDAPRHQDFLVDGTRHWTSVAMGRAHTCAVGDGGVYCFGTDDRGVLGSFDEHRELPADKMFDGGHLVAGQSFSCTTSVAGTYCWGSNSDGELGNNEIATAREPVMITGIPNTQLVSAGRGHTCAVGVDDNGIRQVACWGDNRKGQVDATDIPFYPAPHLVGALDNVAAGGDHSCARDQAAENLIRCWGDNSSRQLGPASGPGKGLVDVTTLGLGSVTQWGSLAAGNRTTCATDDLSHVVCWGDLPGTKPTASPPTVATGMYNVELSLGGGVLLASDKTTRNTIAFGASPADDCSPRDDYPMPHLVDPQGATEIIDLAMAKGGAHGCQLTKTTAPGKVKCWGANDATQTGVMPASPCTQPHDVPAPAGHQWDAGGAHLIAAGGKHTCAIADDHQIYCWGLVDLGVGGAFEGMTAEPKRGVSGQWTAITAGPAHMCGITTTNAGLGCWGENRFGEVGNGFRFHPEPVPVAL